MAEAPRFTGRLSRKKRLEQDLAHVSQEMYKRNLELAETNRTLSLLRTIDNLALESHESLEVLAGQLTQSIIANSNYSFVALLTKNVFEPELRISGLSLAIPFKDHEELNKLINNKIKIDKNWLENKQRTALVQLSDTDLEAIEGLTGWTKSRIEKLHQKVSAETLYAVKLQARQKVVGMLILGLSDKVNALPENEIKLVDRLSEALGLAVDSKLLLQQNQHVLIELRKANEKLVALDQTKDDFISMASHQLRTPLTSVKGYVSMVIEGDVGKITKQQKKLLDQAYVSSQRMVYLIADLLNVSRLRTGKFVIDSKPANLAEVVEGELSQLKETAASRQLELVYKKPKTFPILNFDETKIRQVVMNFADNAIYYTPAGGHITVNVEDKGESVEFTVTDDGIGVPKAEQHNLFSKFYRAENAKKARPDGTGLGLFMAKKVIIAQGGSLIFKSAEGKGSTFGFSFSKKALSKAGTSTTTDDQA